MIFAPREATLPELGLRYLEAGAGPAVLFLHGWAAFAEIWWGTMRALAPRYRVVALEWPGHGSTPADQEILELAELASRAARAVEALGIGPATVVGHSLGGRVAALQALDHAATVSRLVLVDAALSPAYITPLGRRLLAPRELQLSQWLSGLLGRGIGPLRPSTHDHAGGFLRPYLRRARYEALADPRSLQVYLNDLFTGDVEQRLPDLKLPTMVITGARDPLISPRQARRAAELIPGARLAVLPRALHNPMDESPGAFHRLLYEWLEQTELRMEH